MLEGAARPGHFEGVATVVLILLEVVAPHVLWLGQKDAQQAVLIERMARDLRLPVKVRRGPDGARAGRAGDVLAQRLPGARV